ncbi:Translation initiation inhibitor [Candidatus Burkholderia brachyanthoides]|nr:Translation initiation inhibitor [Candidatus Burkholderia brachyanthoides]
MSARAGCAQFSTNALEDVRQPVSAVFYESEAMSARSRAFLDFMASRLVLDRLLSTFPHRHTRLAMPSIELINAPGLPVPAGHRPFEEQAEQALQNVRTVLEAAGAGLADCIEVTVYLVGVEHWKDSNAIYACHFSEWKPAHAVVPVTAPQRLSRRDHGARVDRAELSRDRVATRRAALKPDRARWSDRRAALRRAPRTGDPGPPHPSSGARSCSREMKRRIELVS